MLDKDSMDVIKGMLRWAGHSFNNYKEENVMKVQISWFEEWFFPILGWLINFQPFFVYKF